MTTPTTPVSIPHPLPTEALDHVARSFGLSSIELLPGSFTDEHGQPGIAFRCSSPLHLHLFDVFRIEDKMSELAGVTVMLFPVSTCPTVCELLGLPQ
jgi:hypothetical protein